ncbi:MAG TPA: DUF4296 domain-containing protein [Agriterribacter sp.]|nr:DUF4296 domain-containing protein [Agriterribacter sp.]
MRVALCIVLVAVWMLMGCSGKKVPSGVIEPHEMGNILFEITMAEEFVNAFVAKDSSKNKEAEIQKEYQKIFLLHRITEAQFKKSYDFYRSHTGIFKTMMDSLNARSQRARNDLYRMPN